MPKHALPFRSQVPNSQAFRVSQNAIVIKTVSFAFFASLSLRNLTLSTASPPNNLQLLDDTTTSISLILFTTSLSSSPTTTLRTTTAMADSKSQPWKGAWPADNQTSSSSIEYGISKGDVAVVDGTAANVKPTARVTSESESAESSKTQPWKASWPGADAPSSTLNEYGVAKGDTVVVDGTAANVKPSTRKTVRVVRQ